MGKWSKFRNDFEKLPAEAERAQAIEDLKKELVKLSDRDLAEKLMKTRDEQDELKAKTSALEVEKEAMTKVLLERWEAEGVESSRYEGLGLFSIVDDIYVSVPPEKKPDLFAWLREQGLGDVIREDVPYQTMAALVKERLEGGDPVPEQVKCFIKQTIRRTK